MSNRTSENPMRYCVKSASGNIKKYFRNKDNAYVYFHQTIKDYPEEVIVIEDRLAKTILNDSNSVRKEAPAVTEQVATSGYIAEDSVKEVAVSYVETNNDGHTVYEYDKGHLVRKEINGKSHRTPIGFFTSIFNRKKGK